MERITYAKAGIMAGAAAVGAWLSELFGGWDAALTTLIIFMAVDYVTGLIVAGVFGASDKSPSGQLESRAGWKGLCRKGVSLLIVLIAARLDVQMGTTVIRNAVAIAYIANETISIIENAGLMGLPVPQALVNAIEALQGKDGQDAKKG